VRGEEVDPSDMSPFEVREFLGLEDWESPDGEHLILHCRHPKHHLWAVKAVFEVHANDVVLSQLTIFPVGEWSPPGGLTDEVRRSVRLEELRRRAKARLQLQEVASSVGVDPSDFQRNTARGRKGRSDLDFALIAAEYVALGDHAAELLAENKHVSVVTVRGWLWQARKRGLLGLALAGKAGGHITDKAQRLLDGAR
jgi:hypothetical protein